MSSKPNFNMIKLCKISFLLLISIFFFGCYSTFFRPLDNRNLWDTPLPSNDFNGLSIELENPVIFEYVTLLANKYPDAYIIFSPYYGTNNLIYDGSVINSESFYQEKLEVGKFLIFHNREMIVFSEVPKELKTESYLKIAYESLSEKEENLYRSNFDIKNPYVRPLAITGFIILQGIDLCTLGLIFPPLKSTGYLGYAQSADVYIADTTIRILPSKESTQQYRSGGLWAIPMLFFTDVGGSFTVGPSFHSSTYSYMLEKSMQTIVTNKINVDKKSVENKQKYWDLLSDKWGLKRDSETNPRSRQLFVKGKNIYVWDEFYMGKNVMKQLIFRDSKIMKRLTGYSLVEELKRD